MQWGHEEATQESSRRGARQVRRLSPERGQKVGEPRKWPQGRPGQKPQEDHRCPPQRASSAPRPPEKLIETVIAAICARFGDCAISLGDGGIRFAGSR